MDNNNVVNLQSREQLKTDKGLAIIFSLMPENIQDTFSDEQLKNLKVAITATSWKKHAIDIRSSISLFSYRYYYVLIAGRDQREMTRRESRLKRNYFFRKKIVREDYSSPTTSRLTIADRSEPVLIKSETAIAVSSY